jgi:hypothetical protein
LKVEREMALSGRRICDLVVLAVLLLVGFLVFRSWDSEDARDLLPLIDPAQDAILGEWQFEGDALVSPTLQWARIQIPYIPPDEYDLKIEAERKEGHDALAVGLASGDTNFSLWLDGFPNRKGLSGLDLLDGKLIENNPESVPGRHIENRRRVTIEIAVRKRGVSLKVDGKAVLNWRGDYKRLSPSPVWRARDPRVPLFLGVDSSQVVFTKVTLNPVSGYGKRLR